MDMSVKVRTRALALILVLLCAVPSVIFAQQTTSREYPYIHKSIRAMGMGGAYTAVGGRVDSLFYNPAGLINIPRDKGWEVNLLNLTAAVGENAANLNSMITKLECGDDNFCSDLQDALDTEDLNQDGEPDDDQLRAMNDVLTKYRGKSMHIRISDFTSIGKSYDRWAFGIGGIASSRLDTISHQGFGADGFLEMNSDLMTGALGGASLGIKENVFAGLALKAIKRESLIHNFSTRELVENQDDLENYIEKELLTKGEAIGIDAGVLWNFAPESAFKPSLGASLMNIGGLHFGEAGSIPMTVNAGISINPTFSPFRSLIVGIDYIDVLNNYKQDKDMAKRLRFGAELQLFDIWPAELALRLGMYANSPTFGFDVRLLFITASYAMYTEEIGAYAGQDKDKRQLMTLNIGW